MDAVTRACPFTKAEVFHVFVLMSATGAQLTGSKGLADFHDGLPVPVCLVLQHAEERRPTDVRDGLAQLTILLHVLHLQGLDPDDVVFLDDFGRYLVQEVCALVGDLLVGTGNLPLLLLIVPRLGQRNFLVQSDALTAGELALFARQFLLELTEVTVVLVYRAVRQDGEVLQSDVDADR